MKPKNTDLLKWFLENWFNFTEHPGAVIAACPLCPSNMLVDETGFRCCSFGVEGEYGCSVKGETIEDIKSFVKKADEYHGYIRITAFPSFLFPSKMTNIYKIDRSYKPRSEEEKALLFVDNDDAYPKYIGYKVETDRDEHWFLISNDGCEQGVFYFIKKRDRKVRILKD